MVQTPETDYWVLGRLDARLGYLFDDLVAQQYGRADGEAAFQSLGFDDVAEAWLNWWDED